MNATTTKTLTTDCETVSQFIGKAGETVNLNDRWVTIVKVKETHWWEDEDGISGTGYPPRGSGDISGDIISNWTEYETFYRSATEAEIEKGKEAIRLGEIEKQREAAIREAAIQEQQAWEKDLAALVSKRDDLIRGLTEVKNLPAMAAYRKIQAGELYEPNRGFSSLVVLSYWLKEEEIVAVSWGNPEAGLTYWANAEIVAASNNIHRVAQWWRPGTYLPDSYPGPGVPREDLTLEELAQVEVWEKEKWLADQKKMLLTWENEIKFNFPGGSVKFDTSTAKFILSLPKKFHGKALIRLSRLNEISTRYGRTVFEFEIR